MSQTCLPPKFPKRDIFCWKKKISGHFRRLRHFAENEQWEVLFCKKLCFKLKLQYYYLNLYYLYLMLCVYLCTFLNEWFLSVEFEIWHCFDKVLLQSVWGVYRMKVFIIGHKQVLHRILVISFRTLMENMISANIFRTRHYSQSEAKKVFMWKDNMQEMLSINLHKVSYYQFKMKFISLISRLAKV